MNAQFVAQQKARGERLTGFAQAEVIREQGHARADAAEAMLNKLPKVDQNTVLAGQILDGKDNVMLTPIGIGTSLTELIAKTLGGKTT